MKVNLFFESKWVVKGNISADNDIDLSDENFSIEIKDILEHYLERSCHEECMEVLSREAPLIKINNGENISDSFIYYNSDDYSLVKNGFQYWLSDKKTITFRMTARGTSTINPSGYKDDSIGGQYSGMVGFSMALVNVRISKNEDITFNVFIVPKFETSDIYRNYDTDLVDYQIPKKPYKICPLCHGTGIVLSPNNLPDVSCSACSSRDYFADRYGYPYYNAVSVQDMIYLHESSAAWSGVYESHYDDVVEGYVTELTSSGTTQPLPLYEAMTSAIIPSYLVTGTTIDLLNPSISAEHNFHFNYDEGIVSSCLKDGDGSKYTDIPFEMFTGYQVDTTYFKYNDDCISGVLNVDLIIQKISADTTDITGKTVFFGTEIL
jgi:hypothetical protein